MNNHPERDDQIALRVSRTLGAGVVVSSLLMVSGLAIAFLTAESRPEGAPQSLNAIIHSALRGNGVALMSGGLLVLMVTPIVRVAVLAGSWLFAKQWRLAAIACSVLVLLLTGLWLGVS